MQISEAHFTYGGNGALRAGPAIAFAREGADVVMSYLPEEEEDAARIANLIEKAGRKAVKVPGDLKDSAVCRTLVETAVRELGGLDILVNNAGKQVAQKALGDITDVEFDHTVNIERILGQRGIQGAAVRVGQQQRPCARYLPARDQEDALVEGILQPRDVGREMEVNDLFGDLVGQGDYIHTVSLPPALRAQPGIFRHGIQRS